MKVHAAVYNLDMTEKYARDAAADISEDSATRVFALPDIAGLSTTYFVSLSLSEWVWRARKSKPVLAVHQTGDARLG